MIPPFTAAVHDFFIGQHATQALTPPHGSFSFIGEIFFKELQEYPLGPFKIRRIRGINLTVPVITKPQLFDLFAETVYIFFGGGFRVSPRLDSVLFGRQPKGIPPHGMQHLVSQHAFVAR